MASESRWSKETPSQDLTGRGAFIYFALLLSYLAVVGVASGLPPYIGAFALGLFVIGVLRHNARASGSDSRWRIWSIAWILTWGALSVTLGSGTWLGWGALTIAYVAFNGLVPQPEAQTASDSGDCATADRGRTLNLRWWAVATATGIVEYTLALIVAAVLLAGVELTWQGLIVAVAVIEGGMVATVATGRALLLPYADVPDEETSLARGLLGMGAIFLGLVWAVVAVPVAAWLTDGFSIHGPLALTATIALTWLVNRPVGFVRQVLMRRVRPVQDSRLD